MKAMHQKGITTMDGITALIAAMGFSVQSLPDLNTAVQILLGAASIIWVLVRIRNDWRKRD
jgi:threonine/homoserine/homoserine lactone efflux protein